MEADLRLALHRGEFELNYQPLYNLAEERVTGFEALMRWNSPTRGRVAPADFIPLAEQTGLIIPIGEWVLRTACAEAAAWPDHVRVAVNLSPVQTKNKRLRGAGARNAGANRSAGPTAGTGNHRDRAAAGYRGGHDDAAQPARYGRAGGDGRFRHRLFVAELSAPLPVRQDQDRPVVHQRPSRHPERFGGRAAGRAFGRGKSAATIVRAIVGLGANLGISTTAEGVETAQQFAQIRQKGCTEVQGYFISPPRPAPEVADAAAAAGHHPAGDRRQPGRFAAAGGVE